jgi:hypothetical protein
VTRNPYGPATSRFGHLAPFGSRYAPSQEAPLFHTALGDEDEEEEDRRDAADLAALQRSRRVIAANRMEESSEAEGDGSHPSLRGSGERRYPRYQGAYGDRGAGRALRSSWNGAKSDEHERLAQDGDAEEPEDLARLKSHESDESKGKMSDVGLESEYTSNDPPADLTMETPVDDDPPPFQKFRSPPAVIPDPLRRSSTQSTDFGQQHPPSSAATSIVPTSALAPEPELFRFDPFFAWIYLIALASLLATFVLVWLHTSPPKRRIGDTIYTVLQASFDLLLVDTIVSIIVSLVWLAMLRSFVKPLVALILVAVPVIMFSFALYPAISSFQGRTHGGSVQDWVMRWASIVPGVGAICWLYLVWQGRRSISSAIRILEFSSRVLAENSALVLVGLGSLAAVVFWTWAWLAMFTRIFLGGEYSSRLSKWIISTSSWWLGIFFVLMYIWTLSIISGVQRGTTAATVSQWYFHRNAAPRISSSTIVSAALKHSLTTIFGSISLSTLLSLGVRLPLLMLPARMGRVISLFASSFVPTPITALTNPLSITYAAIHSEPLVQAARDLGRMDFVGSDATATLNPRIFAANRNVYGPLLPYRLAKLLLYATRFIMATALGFAGWVITAKQLRITLPDGMGVRGSLYAYVVGLVASFIGWGILGSMEGILGGIVDATVICYGTEKRMATGGYCMEAAHLFGDRGREGDTESGY